MTAILAYLDPGSSSMIVQMALGGVAAAGVALKLYWRRLLKFLHLRKEDPEEGLYPPTTGDTDDHPAVATSSPVPSDEAKQPVESGHR